MTRKTKPAPLRLKWRKLPRRSGTSPAWQAINSNSPTGVWKSEAHALFFVDGYTGQHETLDAAQRTAEFWIHQQALAAAQAIWPDTIALVTDQAGALKPRRIKLEDE